MKFAEILPVYPLASASFRANGLGSLELAVIIPVRNERDNIVELLNRLAVALAGTEWEAVFVDDDSTDGTPELVESLAAADSRIRLLRRFGRRGLSSAVVEGMLATIAPVLAVIDGDLQHDEAILPQLHRAVAAGDCDVAVGSRYLEGGSTGEWTTHRVAISRFATRLARHVTRSRVTDPMSGFFAVSRARMVELAPALSGVGYKILLDLLSSSRDPLRVVEVPYTFRVRTAGESKLDNAVVTQYLELLWDKQFGHLIPARFVKFTMVGLAGLGVHMSVLAASIRLGAAFNFAQTVAVAIAIAFNFFLNNVFTYRDRRLRGHHLAKGLASFYLICAIGAAANVGAGIAVFSREQSWWIAGATGALVGSIWNYAMGTKFTWKR